jgi:hypothetical protein
MHGHAVALGDLMKAFVYGIALAGLVLAARSASADASLDRVRACMPQQSDAARLACYDRELGRTTAAPPVPTTATTPISPAKSATAATATVSATAPVRTAATVPATAAVPVAAAVGATAAVPATAAVSATAPAPATPTASPTPGKSADFGMTPELRRKQEVQAGIKPPASPPAESLSAKVARIGTYGNGLLVVTLDNGQVWEQQESGDAQLAVGEAVKISRGMFGALWMDDASHRRTRVKRIQ